MRTISGLLILAAAVWAIKAFVFDVPRSEADRVTDALSNYYRENDIYSPVRCSGATGGAPERQWVLCRATSGSTTGGLLTVDSRDGRLAVWAVNGRAVQHIGGRDANLAIYDFQQNDYALAAWGEYQLDIPAALSLFQ